MRARNVVNGHPENHAETHDDGEDKTFSFVLGHEVQAFLDDGLCIKRRAVSRGNARVDLSKILNDPSMYEALFVSVEFVKCCSAFLINRFLRHITQIVLPGRPHYLCSLSFLTKASRSRKPNRWHFKFLLERMVLQNRRSIRVWLKRSERNGIWD